jgi:glycerol-3-phosphate acyltransferase PlsY
MRVLGKPAGIFVLLLDAFKGWYACQCGLLIFFHFLPQANIHSNADVQNVLKCMEVFPIIAGIFAVLGHNYTCWLKFKGGKGVATTAGVYLALAPVPLAVALAIFVLALLVTRYVSVGSISAAVALPLAVWIMAPDNLLLGIVTTAFSAMAIYKHKSNIKRLMNGTENRIGKNPEDNK